MLEQDWLSKLSMESLIFVSSFLLLEIQDEIGHAYEGWFLHEGLILRIRFP